MTWAAFFPCASILGYDQDKTFNNWLLSIYVSHEKQEDALKAVYDLGFMHGKQSMIKTKKRHGIKRIK